MTFDPIRQSPTGQREEREVGWAQKPLLGGMNSRLHPRFIPEDTAAELINVDLDDPSQPMVRDGYAEIPARATGMKSPSSTITGLGDFFADETAHLLLAAVPGGGTVGGLYYTANPDDAAGWTESLVTESPDGEQDGETYDVGGEHPQFFTGLDSCWIVSGSAVPVHIMRTDGTLVSGGDRVTSPPLGGVGGMWFLDRPWILTRNRIYWGKVLAGPDEVAEASAFDRKDIPSDSAVAGFLNLSPTTGSRMIGVTPWRGTQIVLFGTQHIERVLVNAADPLLSRRETLEARFGCVARDTITPVGPEIYFLDNYGEIRALAQTVTGEQRGVLVDPISDPIRSWFPNRINKQNMHKSFALIREERIWFFFPRDASQECDTIAVFHPGRTAALGRPVWESIWLLAHPASHGVNSTIRQGFPEQYIANTEFLPGTTKARVYRMYAGTFSDDGEPIVYRETSRAVDFNVPEAEIRPIWAQLEISGSAGVKMSVSARVDDNTGFSVRGELTVPADSKTSYPILSTDYPLLSSDHPLIGSVDQTLRDGVHFDPSYTDYPLYSPDYPLYNRDYPKYDDPGGTETGPFGQFRLQASVTGAKIIRKGLRAKFQIEPVQLEADT